MQTLEEARACARAYDEEVIAPIRRMLESHENCYDADW